jgi:PAS domain S-box-containing protein
MVRRPATPRFYGRRIRRSRRGGPDPPGRVPSDDPLLKNEEWLRLAKQGSPLGLWYWNEDTGRVFWDAPACEMFGVDPADEYLPGTFYDCLHADDRERVRQVWRHQLEHGLPYDLDYRVVRPDGTIRCIHALGSGYYDKAGRPLRMVGVVFDVTERLEAERAQQELSGRLITAREEERRHLARELHDDFSQRISILRMDRTDMADLIGGSAPAAQARVQGLIDSVDAISSDLHSLSHRLHSMKLELLGLPSSSELLCAEFSRHHGVSVRFVPVDLPLVVPPDAALCLYRVLQEALRNVGKHSGAARVEVTLTGGAAAISLTIADNGVGFDAASVASKGIGIQSMRERVRMLAGTLEVQSRPMHGTTISVTVPCECESAVIVL